MKYEIRVFFTALMYYTRIPCPGWIDHSDEYINQSIRYFPFIGWLIGGVMTVAFLLGNWAVSPLFGIVLGLMATVLTTGAFHEDGLADVCDGFGGGWTKDKILMIMKDSQVGSYGVIGLVLSFLCKMSLLWKIIPLANEMSTLFIFVSAHSISRFMAATFVFSHQYVRETDDSKSKPVAKQSSKSNLIPSAIFGILPLGGLAWLMDIYGLLIIIPILYLAKTLLGRYFTKWIGGYTGDCLGATQQVIEVIFYLCLLMIWKFTL